MLQKKRKLTDECAAMRERAKKQMIARATTIMPLPHGVIPGYFNLDFCLWKHVPSFSDGVTETAVKEVMDSMREFVKAKDSYYIATHVSKETKMFMEAFSLISLLWPLIESVSGNPKKIQMMRQTIGIEIPWSVRKISRPELMKILQSVYGTEHVITTHCMKIIPTMGRLNFACDNLLCPLLMSLMQRFQMVLINTPYGMSLSDAEIAVLADAICSKYVHMAENKTINFRPEELRIIDKWKSRPGLSVSPVPEPSPNSDKDETEESDTVDDDDTDKEDDDDAEDEDEDDDVYENMMDDENEYTSEFRQAFFAAAHIQSDLKAWTDLVENARTVETILMAGAFVRVMTKENK